VTVRPALVLAFGLIVTIAACGGSGDNTPAPATPAAPATPTANVYATATAWTALATATPNPANATSPAGIPTTAAGKQLAWALQFLFSIDPTQLDPQDIAPRFTDEFLAALPVDRLTASIKTFTDKHGQASFTGFVSPPTDTSVAAYLTTASGEKFILKLQTEDTAPYRISMFRVEPAPT